MALARSRTGFTPTEVSALIGLLPLVSLLATPAWSLAADRHGLGMHILLLTGAARQAANFRD
jgi:hypothetical protein